MIDKQNLRKTASIIRKNVVSRVQKDCQIRQKMIELLKVDVTSVFCYVSMGSEVDTTLLIRELRENMNVYVPYTYNGEMQAVKLKEETLTYEVDKQGNLYGENERVQVLFDSPQVCVVPLLAYNDKLYRLGYGGGYYDKYLSSHKTLKIGICYDEQFIDFAQEQFDVPMDIIVTPTRILRR